MSGLTHDYVIPDDDAIDSAEELARGFRQSPAYALLCQPVHMDQDAIDKAVVVGMGDDPWTDDRVKKSDLESMHCRILIGPAEDGWYFAKRDQSVSIGINEGGTLAIMIRRQVSDSEISNYGRPHMHKWFWYMCNKIVKEAFELTKQCAELDEFDGLDPPLWNPQKQRGSQGNVLHAVWSVAYGDAA